MKADLKSIFAGQASVVLGGIGAALWTPSTYLYTYGTFLTGAGVSKELEEFGKITSILAKVHLKGHPGGPHKYPHIQIIRYLKNIKGSHKPWRIPWWKK